MTDLDPRLIAKQLNLMDKAATQLENPDTRKAAGYLANTRNTAASLGIDPSTETEAPSGLLYNITDTLATPQQWLYGVGFSALEGNLAAKGVVDSAKFGAEMDLTGSDLLRKMGWEAKEEDSTIGKWLTNASRGVAGFALDVATDPLAWVPGLVFGKSAAAATKLTGAVKLSDEGAAMASKIDDILAGSNDVQKLVSTGRDELIDSTIWEALNNLGKVAGKTDEASLLKAQQASNALSEAVDLAPDVAGDLQSILGDLAEDPTKLFDSSRKAQVNIDLPFVGWFDKDQMSYADIWEGSVNTYNKANPLSRAGWMATGALGALSKTLGMKTLTMDIPAPALAQSLTKFGIEGAATVNQSLSRMSEIAGNAIVDSANAVSSGLTGIDRSKEALESAKDISSELGQIKKAFGKYSAVNGNTDPIFDILQARQSTLNPETYAALKNNLETAVEASVDSEALRAELAPIYESLDSKYKTLAFNRAAETATKKVQDAKRLSSEAMRRIGGLFSNEIAFGADVNRGMRILSTERGAAEVRSIRMMSDYVPELMAATDQERATRSVAVRSAIDDAYQAVAKTLDEMSETQSDFNMVERFNQILERRRVGQADPTSMTDDEVELIDFLSGQVYEQLTETLMAKGDTATLNTIQQLDGLAQDLRAQEVAWGIDTPRTMGPYVARQHLDYQLQRIASNAQEGKKYATLGEAFASGGLSPDYDVLRATKDRIKSSYEQIAEKKFMQRMSMLHFLKPEQYETLRANAWGNPNSPEAKILHEMGDTVAEDMRALGGSFMNNLAYFMKSETPFDDFITKELAQGTDGELLSEFAIMNDMMSENVAELASAMGKPPPAVMRGEAATYVDDVYRPKVIQDAINEAKGASDWLKKIDNSKFVKYFDALRAAQKGPLVYAYAASHMANVLGDRAFAFAEKGWDAASPLRSIEINLALSGKRPLVLKNGTSLSGEKLQELFDKHGMSGSPRLEEDYLDTEGELMDIISGMGKATKKSSGLRKQYEAFQSSQVSKTAKASFDAIRNPGYEQVMRRQAFVHYLDEGLMPADAALKANDLLIDYKDMTQFERSIMKRTFLFYGFLKGSTKKTFKNLFLNPTAINREMQASNALAQMFSIDTNNMRIEDFLHDNQEAKRQNNGAAFVTGYTEDGTPIVSRVGVSALTSTLEQFPIMAPRSMTFDEVANAAEDSIWGVTSRAVSASNPLIKVAIEQLTGQNMFFDVPNEALFLRSLPDLARAGHELSQYPLGEIPGTVLKTLAEPVQRALGAVPVPGKPGLVAVNPTAYAIMTQILPAVGRGVSLANKAVDPEMGIAQAALNYSSPVKPRAKNLDAARFYDEVGRLEDKIALVTGGGSLKKARKAAQERQRALSES